jgi:hypothetical protein
MLLDVFGKRKRARVDALEFLEEWPKGRESFRGLVRSSKFCVALIAIERSIRNLNTRRIAAQEMEDAWTVLAAYKLACAITRRA